MENNEEYLNRMTIKLKVLSNRIEKLKSLTDEVMSELNSAYQQELKELILQEETAQQILSKIQEAGRKK